MVMMSKMTAKFRIAVCILDLKVIFKFLNLFDFVNKLCCQGFRITLQYSNRPLTRDLYTGITEPEHHKMVLIKTTHLKTLEKKPLISRLGGRHSGYLE